MGSFGSHFAGGCFSSVPEFVSKPRGFYVVSLVVTRDVDEGQWGNEGRFPSRRRLFVPVVPYRAAAPALPLLPPAVSPGFCCQGWQTRLSHHGFTGIRAQISHRMELLRRMRDGSGCHRQRYPGCRPSPPERCQGSGDGTRRFSPGDGGAPLAVGIPTRLFLQDLL